MVRRMASWAAGAVFAFLAIGCEPQRELPDPAEVLAARQAAFRFETRLRNEILDRLDRGEDPVAVYLAYADNVPGWGKEISDEARFDFSRTALGPRNPANAPDDWERRQMETFNFLYETGLDPSTFEAAEIVQEGNEKVFRWLKPTMMTEECLVCHGEELPPRIKLILGQEYPLDEATGYVEAALGGAFSIRKVLSVGGKPPPPYEPKPLPPRLPADERQPGDAPLIEVAPPPVEEPIPEPSPYDLPVQFDDPPL